jgi:hypothetical protein
MNARRAWMASLFLLSLALTPASAQEPGDTGITMSAPSAIGFVWHASSRVAIRPQVTFTVAETDGESSIPDLDSRNVTVAGSALVYAGKWDSLRTYVSPRLSYSHARSSFEGGGTH